MYCYQKVYHIIRPGDTIYWLAKMYDTTVEEIMDNNPGINPHNMQIGARIVICPGKAGGAQVIAPSMPGQSMQGQPMQGQPMPSQPMQGQPMPGQSMPSQSMLGQPMFGQPVPSQSMFNLNMPEYRNMFYEEDGYYNSTEPYPATRYAQPMMGSYGRTERNQLHDDMRKVWAQHVYWTRMLLISIAGHMADQSAVTTKLMQNPQEIAGLFSPYFSEESADKIEKLLVEHLQIGAELITALHDKQMDKANELNGRWHVNGDRIAEALAAMNPKYDKRELQNMFRKHLELTTKEVSARLADDYVEDIKAFDQVEQEAQNMADYLSKGIVQ